METKIFTKEQFETMLNTDSKKESEEELWAVGLSKKFPESLK